MKLSLWDSKTLLVLLAAGQGASLVYASAALDGNADPQFVTAVAIVRGVLVGIGASFAASYSSFQLPRVKHKAAQKIGWWALGFLIVCSILAVSISSVGTPQGWLRWVVSVGYSVLTDAAVVAVAVSGGKLFLDEQPAMLTQSQPEVKPKRAKPVEEIALPAIAPAPVAIAIPCKYGCGFERATSQALNAHYRGCKKNPANMPIAVDLGSQR